MRDNFKIKVGVLRGGIGDEYDISLKTGGNVLKSLPNKYEGYDILITKNGTWHLDGVEIFPTDLIKRVDVIFNALHGEYGEDGKVQQELNIIGVPYTGSSAFSSAIAMNKILAKNYFKNNKIKTLISEVIHKDDDLNERALAIFRTLPQPSIVKPVSGGSSFGVYKAESYDDLLNAIKKSLQFSDTVMVEEYVAGREATCVVVDDFRGESHYAFPPIEIRTKPEYTFFNHEAKYNGTTDEICPGNFSKSEREFLIETSKSAHRALGLQHYSRSDFILSPRGIYILETNNLPGLTEESLLPKSLTAVGSNMSEFLDHVITLALHR